MTIVITNNGPDNKGREQRREETCWER